MLESHSRAAPQCTAAPLEFRTTDIDLAALIAALGTEPLRLEPPDPSTVPALTTFVFPVERSVAVAVHAWREDSPLLVRPQSWATWRCQLFRAVRKARDVR